MQRSGVRQSSLLNRISADNLSDMDVVIHAMSTIKDLDKMRGFRDDLAKSIRDDPNFHKGERDSLLMAEGSIRSALIDPRIPHNQFNAWAHFLRENATAPIDQEVRPALTRQARR